MTGPLLTNAQVLAETRTTVIDQLCAKEVMCWRLAQTANDLVGYDKPSTGEYLLRGEGPTAKVEVLMLSSGPEGFTQDWSPATDMTTAFRLVEKVKGGLIFSARARFWNNVDVRTNAGDRIIWPSALLYLTPMHLCKAALIAHRPEDHL